MQLGPTCLEVIKSRAALRGKGPNSRMLEKTNSGLPHMISDISSVICPDNELHCIECPYRADKECPLERATKGNDGN